MLQQWWEKDHLKLKGNSPTAVANNGILQSLLGWSFKSSWGYRTEARIPNKRLTVHNSCWHQSCKPEINWPWGLGINFHELKPSTKDILGIVTSQPKKKCFKASELEVHNCLHLSRKWSSATSYKRIGGKLVCCYCCKEQLGSNNPCCLMQITQSCLIDPDLLFLLFIFRIILLNICIYHSSISYDFIVGPPPAFCSIKISALQNLIYLWQLTAFTWNTKTIFWDSLVCELFLCSNFWSYISWKPKQFSKPW